MPASKTTIPALLVVLSLSAQLFLLADAWTPIGPSDWVRSIAVPVDRPQTIFISALQNAEPYPYGRIWRTTDGGSTWQSRYSTGVVPIIHVSPSNGNLIFVNARESLRRTTDDFVSVDVVTPYTGIQCIDLAIDPSTPGRLFLAHEHSGYSSDPLAASRLLKSTNNGDSWSIADTGINDSKIVRVVVDPVTPHRLYALGQSTGVYRSTDGGVSWENASVGLSHLTGVDLAVSPSNPSVLYYTARQAVYRSEDGGDTWVPAAQLGLEGVDLDRLAVDPLDPASVYVSTSAGVFGTINGGVLWSCMGLATSSVGPLVIDPQNHARLFAGAVGAFVTERANAPDLTVRLNDSSHLERNMSGYLHLTVTNVGRVASTSPMTLTDILPSDARLLSGSGVGWTCSSDGGTVECTSAQTLALNESTGVSLHIAFGSPLTGVNTATVLTAGDVNGANDQDSETFHLGGPNVWVNVGPAGHILSSVLSDPRNEAVLLVGARGAVLRSSDGGETWLPVEQLSSSEYVADLVRARYSPDVVFGGASSLLVSLDGGLTWTEKTGNGDRYLTVVTPHPSDPLIILAASSNRLLRSNDGGDTWTEKILSPALDVNSIAFAPWDSNVVYAAAGDRLLRSDDGGINWVEKLQAAGPVVGITLPENEPVTVLIAVHHQYNQGISRSTDAGETWDPVPFPGWLYSMAETLGPSGALWASSSTGEKAWRTQDLGLDWNEFSDGLEGWRIYGLHVDSAHHVVYALVFDEQDSSNQRLFKLAVLETAGYAMTNEQGGVFNFGSSRFFGSIPQLGVQLNAPVNRITMTPSGAGYYLLGEDGGVFTFGDSQFFGSLPALGISNASVDLEVTRTGLGYYVLGADGGVFAFGDAQFYGSLPSLGINNTALDLEVTPSGQGYWVLAVDGGVFSFGDAAFFGSLPHIGIVPNAPV
ncbi:MAG: hypothetical protein EHM18_14945, partial [Acidobacteria bacterium]